MAILERLISRPAMPEVPGGRGSRRGLEEMLLGGSSSGVSVTEESALRLAAVYACVRVLSETVASLPLIIYERLERGKQRAADHPLYRILHDAPNPVMTAFEYWECVTSHVTLWGNSISEIEFDGAGRVMALWPLRPDSLREVRRLGDTLSYLYQLPDGKEIALPGDRVFHIRGLSSDGITGYSPVRLAREQMGMGLAVEEFGARFFRNGARPGGVLQHPGVLDEEAFERLKATWAESYQGLSNAHRMAILEEGMTYQSIGVPPDEAQFLESMKFNRSQIASIFRIPPHMIGDLERATFSNIEQQSIEFKTYTMEPWLVRIQQAVNNRLLGDGERELYFAEFLADALLRGDTISRYQAHSIGRQNGWLSANDIRVIENMNPIEGGDEYLVPLNMAPAGAANLPEAVVDEGERGDTGYETRDNRGLEIRAEQMDAARARHKLMLAYREMYLDVATRIVKRETNDIGNAARRLLGKGRREEFEAWLESFWTDHVDYIERQYRPLTRSYGAMLAELTKKELGKEETPSADTFLEAYTAAAAERHVGRKAAQLRKKMGEVTSDERRVTSGEVREEITEVEAEPEPEDLDALTLAEIEGLMAHWREVEPDRIAAEESVRANNALAIAFYALLGASTKTWVAFGDNCPYCNSLNGKSVGMDTFFLSLGQSFMPEGALSPLMPSSNIGHAPAHEGCDCMVIAG